jgi:hypothetical protein
MEKVLVDRFQIGRIQDPRCRRQVLLRFSCIFRRPRGKTSSARQARGAERSTHSGTHSQCLAEEGRYPRPHRRNTRGGCLARLWVPVGSSRDPYGNGNRRRSERPSSCSPKPYAMGRRCLGGLLGTTSALPQLVVISSHGSRKFLTDNLRYLSTG